MEEGPADWMKTAEEGTYKLLYFGHHQHAFKILELRQEDSYRIELIDTWQMTVTPLPGTFSGSCRVDLPGQPYMALRIQKLDKQLMWKEEMKLIYTRDVERWGMFELTLDGPSLGNPFMDIQLSARFMKGLNEAYAEGFMMVMASTASGLCRRKKVSGGSRLQVRPWKWTS